MENIEYAFLHILMHVYHLFAEFDWKSKNKICKNVCTSQFTDVVWKVLFG